MKSEAIQTATTTTTTTTTTVKKRRIKIFDHASNKKHQI